MADEKPDEQAWRRPEPGTPDPSAPDPPTVPATSKDEPNDRPAPPRPDEQDDPASPWRRPHAAVPPDPPAPPGPPGAGGQPYAGPQPTQPPPSGWRTPFVLQAAAPRDLPAQDVSAIERDERGARTLTLGVGMIAGAIALIVTCLLCSRVLF